MSREAPVGEMAVGEAAAAEGAGEVAKQGDGPAGTAPQACDRRETESFLFDDPYWDDAFDSYHDQTLRTCCRV